MHRLLGSGSLATLLGLAVVAIACSSKTESVPGEEAPDGGDPLDPTRPGVDSSVPDAENCNVRFSTETILPSFHLDAGTPITYATTPPTSGPHYFDWANFQEYITPVPYPYLVHAMEHGAIVLLYKCPGPDGPECTERREALRAVRRTLPVDPKCDAVIEKRVIIAPQPDLDSPLVVAAWGVTYRADCVDRQSISDFAKNHYDVAPESSCQAGIAFF